MKNTKDKKTKTSKPAALPSYVQIRAKYGDHNVIEFSARLPKSGLKPAELAVHIKAKLPNALEARATYPDDAMFEMLWAPNPRFRKATIVAVQEAEPIEA